MRLTVIALALTFSCGAVLAQGARPDDKPTLASLMENAANAKFLKDGIKRASNYFKFEVELAIGKKGAHLKFEKAREKWRSWLDGSKAAIGLNLYAHPRIVIDVLDEGRAVVLDRLVKSKPGTIDYGSKNAPGYSRRNISYTVLVPRNYAPGKKKPLPLVVTMHGRAINLRHPSLKKAPGERSRIVVWNNWGGARRAPQQDVIVLAPTGRPEGFSFAKAPDFARQTLFLGMGVGHTYYRTDPLRTFVEVYGDMIQVAVEYSNQFAGIIWRDREDQQGPPVVAEQTMIFDNLNGRPIYYVADKKKWDKVGKPMSEALTEAYKRAGKLDNLIIEKVERDANGALLADHEKMAKFLESRLEMPQRQFKWLFWHPNLVGPLPLLLTQADYSYDATEKIAAMPLRDRCGSIEFKATIEMVKDDKGKEMPVNVLDLKITEAQSATVFLYEDMVDLDLPVTVKVNGNVIIDKQVVKRDWAKFEKYCMPRHFFIFPVVGQLDIRFPVVPRVAPEPQKEEGPKKEEGKKTEGEETKGKDAESESKQGAKEASKK